MTDKPKTGDEAVSVAELMARYGVEPSGTGRAHRRRAREGGIPVAELTGEIPVIRPSEPPAEAADESGPDTPESADDAVTDPRTVTDDDAVIDDAGDVAVEAETEADAESAEEADADDEQTGAAAAEIDAVDEDAVDEADREPADEPTAEVDTDADAEVDQADEAESADDAVDADAGDEAHEDVDSEVDSATDLDEDSGDQAVADAQTETAPDEDPAPTQQFAVDTDATRGEDTEQAEADTAAEESPWARTGRRAGAPIAVIPPIAQEFAGGDDRTVAWAEETVVDEQSLVDEYDEVAVDAEVPAERGSFLSTLGQWLALGAQTLIGVVVGAAVFLGFIRLWDVLPYVALVLAVLVILALAAVVRILRKSDDSVSILLAVVVGVIVTIGPLVFVLSSA